MLTTVIGAGVYGKSDWRGSTRSSKRQKDLADISRQLDAYPELRSRVPEDVLSRLI